MLVLGVSTFPSPVVPSPSPLSVSIIIPSDTSIPAPFDTFPSKPKTEAGIRKIPIVPEVRKALDEVKQYQYENGIFCRTEIDGYTNFIFLNRFGNVYLQQTLDRTLARIIDAYNDMMQQRKNAMQFFCHILHVMS